jgi:hypothetical protein
VIFEPRKNIYFSTYPPATLVHLSQLFTSASKPAACKSYDYCFSQFRIWSGIICDFQTSLREFLDPVVNRFTRQTLPTINRKNLFINILCTGFFAYKKNAIKRCFSVVYPSSTVSILSTETSNWTGACASARRLSWSWTVLLSSDTHRIPITSITAVLLPFVTYLVTLVTQK